MISKLPIQINTANFLDANSKALHAKTYLQNYVYYTDEFRESFIQNITTYIELFSYSYNYSVLSLKIKKTTLKKDPSYIHESLYYYNIINKVLYNTLYTIIGTIEDPIVQEIVSNEYNMSLLYSVTTLNDNIINIYF